MSELLIAPVDTNEPAAPEPVPRHDRQIMVGVASVPLATAVVLAILSGAWGIARTDDWSFARVTFALHHTGQFHLIGWAQMNLVGLALWAQPWLWAFGDHQWVLDLAAATLGGAGLAAAWSLARRAVGRTPALIAVGCLVCFPGFLRDIPTFMTDAPALAVQALVLAVGAAALAAAGRSRIVLVGAALALGMWGFSIREFAIAAPLALLATLWLKDRERRQVWAVTGLAFVGGCAALYAWRQGLPGAQSLSGHTSLSTVSLLVVQTACTIGLGLTPALVFTRRAWWAPAVRRIRIRGYLLGAAAALVPPAVVPGGPQWLLGHYLDPAGVNGSVDTVGVRPTLLPGPLWALITVAAIASMVVLCGLLAEWVAVHKDRPAGTPQHTMLAVHVALTLVALIGAAAANGQVFDRYVWAVVLSASLLFVMRWAGTVTPSSHRAGVAALALMGVLTLILTVNSNAFDAARWRAGQSLVRTGLTGQSIDAGFEWVGSHSTGTVDLSGRSTGNGAVSFWSKWFPHGPICALVTASPTPEKGFVLSGKRRWSLVGVGPKRALFLYRSTDPRCSAGLSAR